MNSTLTSAKALVVGSAVAGAMTIAALGLAGTAAVDQRSSTAYVDVACSTTE